MRAILSRALVLGMMSGVAEAAAGPVSFPPVARIEFRLSEPAAGPGLTPAVAASRGDMVYLRPEVVLDNADIVGIRADSRNGEGTLVLTLTAQGTEKLADVTANNTKREICFLVDGQVEEAIAIMAPVRVTELPLAGWWRTEKAAQKLCDRIRGNPALREALRDSDDARRRRLLPFLVDLGRAAAEAIARIGG